MSGFLFAVAENFKIKPVVALLKEKGVKIYEFQDRAKLLQLMQPIFDEWSAKDPLIGEYIQAAKRVDQGS